MKKPPLGLRPRFLWIEERINEVNEAIERYRVESKDIPDDWSEERIWIDFEYNRALREFRKRSKNPFTVPSPHSKPEET